MLSNTKVAFNSENATEGKLSMFSKSGNGWVELTLPIFTVSEANGGVKKSYKKNGKTCYKAEHWSEKSRRHRLQKGTVALMLNPLRDKFKLPCTIKLTRFAPRKLDKYDNLPMSLKYILDAICEVITGDYVPGRADSHEGILVTYDQFVSSEYAVKIRIENIQNGNIQGQIL